VKRVVLTRQTKDSNALASRLREQGVETLQFPLMAIEPLPVDSPQRLSAEHGLTVLVFTSTNAVQYGLHAIRDLASADACTVIAVGKRTLEALQSESIDAIAPEREDSEGILELPIFQDAMIDRVIVVKGEGGRDLLQRALIDRGVTVIDLNCYRRYWPTVDVDKLDQFLEDGAPLIHVASGEAVVRLTDLVSTAVQRQSSLVVPSGRVAHQARALGWHRVEEAEGAGDAAFIEVFSRCE
jgi:uroporphyrinogen-III synthase